MSGIENSSEDLDATVEALTGVSPKQVTDDIESFTVAALQAKAVKDELERVMRGYQADAYKRLRESGKSQGDAKELALIDVDVVQASRDLAEAAQYYAEAEGLRAGAQARYEFARSLLGFQRTIYAGG